MKELINRLTSNRVFLYEIIFSSFFVNILALATPIFVIQVLQRYVAYGVTSTLITLVAGILIILLFEFLLRNIRYKICSEFDVINAKLSNQLFAKIYSIPSAFFIFRDIRLEKLKSNVQFITNSLTGNSLITFIDAPYTIIFLLAVYLLHYQLGLILSLFLIIPFAISGMLNDGISIERKETTSETIKQSMMLNDAVARNITFKFYHLLALAFSAWKANLINLTNHKGTFEDKRNFLSSILNSVSLLLTVTIISWGAILSVNGELSVGALIGANILASRAIAPIIKFVQTLPSYKEIDANIQEIREILALPNEQIKGTTLANFNGTLSVKNLELIYPEGRNPVFSKANFDIKSNEMVCLCGDNGAGKTSLLKLIIGIIPYTSGQIFYDEIEIRQLSTNWLRDNLSYMPQVPEFIDANLIQNIKGTADIDQSQLDRIIDEADLSTFVNKHPQGLLMGISNSKNLLPVGIIKRIAFARALALDKKIFIFDEPTEGLDERGSDKIIERIIKLKNDGKTIIIASSDERIRKHSNKIITV